MKVLFLHKQILFPRDTGGKIRVLNILKHFAQRHEVTYACNLRPGEDALLPEMTNLGLKMEAVTGQPSRRGSLLFYADAISNLASPRPFSVNRNYDPKLRSKVAELVAKEHFDLIVCDCVQMARHTIGLSLPASILFQHNVEAQILERHAVTSANVIRRWYMKSQFRRMEQFERECGQHFDAVIAVSPQDKSIFEQRYGWAHAHAIDTAVDLEYFQPQVTSEIPGRVLFLGSMDWIPNQEGVRFFAEKVWPRVLGAQPSATFQIVGRNPPPSVRSLESLPGVEVVGGVPDVRPFLAQACVIVVPLLVGGGTRLKIYESMAMSKPVVSTAIGAEGLSIMPGIHFLQADQPSEIAHHVQRLLADPQLRRTIGHTADRFVRSNCGSETVASQFEQICQIVVEKHQLRSSCARRTDV